MRFLVIPVLITVIYTCAQVDIDTLSDNSIVQIPTQNEYPRRGVDIKCAIDTSGYMYMIGGCTYGNVAGGTHNSDVYRINIKTGWFDKLYNNSTNPYKGGCQAGHTYDPTRNCVWFGNGSSSSRYSGIMPGLWKLQCPDGPVTKYSDTLLATGTWSGVLCQYFVYDQTHDAVIGVGPYCLVLFYLQSRDTLRVANPFGKVCSFEIPCCMDTKRGLLAITLTTPGWDPTGAPIMKDIWFFNPADTSWHKKTPSVAPDIARAELAYDSKNDKYIYFGSGAENDCETQVWAYDYDSNTWTQQSRNGRSYNDNSPETSTWPAQRSKHAFEYCVKYNVFASWGGMHYEPWITKINSCSDDEHQQPLWVYRYSNDGTALEGSAWYAGEDEWITVSPNPFNSMVNIKINYELGIRNYGWRKIELKIFNITGKMIADLTTVIPNSSFLIRNSLSWNPSGHPPGLYLLEVSSKTGAMSKKLFLIR
jgi:hypothetical protein